MQLKNNKIFFSPSDLIIFMESQFASHMERSRLEDPNYSSLMDPEDAMLKNLQKRGFEHEDAFLFSLIASGKKVIKIDRSETREMRNRTQQAMVDGAEVIAQAYLELDNFGGIADFLIKVEGESTLGDYHYEIWDAKLSKKMKPYFAIQLCCYAEMLESEQGRRPEKVAIVLGDDEVTRLRVKDYYGYYQQFKRSFLLFHTNWTQDHQPDPSDSNNYGRWSQYAGKILAERRHLSLVANITRTQIKRLNKAGIATIDELAGTSLTSIPKLNAANFERLKSQAEIQIASEGKEKPHYQILQHAMGRKLGLALLPPHSASDIFFDIEGFPLIDGGLEYLWGATFFNELGERRFKDFWAHAPEQELAAFSDFVDWIFACWKKDPSMHVYHYASYEVAVLRRLMGRYGVKEYKVDTLLRNGVFIDLYNIVRNGVLIGEPNYSIKSVEHLYANKRQTEVVGGGESVVLYEEWRSNPDGKTWQTSPMLKAIRDYNIDDCNSTQQLAEWLRSKQDAHKIKYVGSSSEDIEQQDEEEESQITLLRDQILQRAEAETDENIKDVIGTLAWLLEFHQRENKPTWWRLFDRLGLTEIDLYDDMDCLVGLQRTNLDPFLPTPRSKNKVFEYAFDPNQPFKGQTKSFYILGEDKTKVTATNIDQDKGLIKLQSKIEPDVRLSLLPDDFVRPAPIPEAIQSVIEKLLENNFAPSAITDFLFRRKPRFVDGPKKQILPSLLTGEPLINSIVAAVNSLDRSYLCIQGPPGAGKTFTAQHIIGNLLSKGKRIGISSNSHKAIINLMAGVADHLLKENITGQLIKVGGDSDDTIFNKPNVIFKKNAQACGNELNASALCMGGTAWLFCNPNLTQEQGITIFDYLFIDEAGQVSIANLVGMSRIAKNIILMGDQMQLGQPSQGSHPGDSGLSILEYLLKDQATIPVDMGVFLPTTYRMHTDVCRLISEQVYDGRLESAEVTSKHVIEVPSNILPINQGVQFFPINHEGNTQGSEEEVEFIKRLAEQLIGLSYWPETLGEENRSIGWFDILFVAPYNYQVNLLKSALPLNARVGSVDKFQGQEAPIVFVSMCASDASESARGIEFLFSKNRLNVAISRAQSLAIIVGSRSLTTTPVKTLRQMELINFYSEIAEYGSHKM